MSSEDIAGWVVIHHSGTAAQRRSQVGRVVGARRQAARLAHQRQGSPSGQLRAALRGAPEMTAPMMGPATKIQKLSQVPDTAAGPKEREGLMEQPSLRCGRGWVFARVGGCARVGGRPAGASAVRFRR